jgi:hypothetical protein
MRPQLLFFLFFSLIFTMQAQVYPPPACVDYQDGILVICPPDSVPDYTGGLLGYNIYMDDEFLEFNPFTSPTDTLIYTFSPLPLPGNRVFCATAVYVAWISDQTCDSTLVYYGYDIPFTEDWSSASFETNNWTQESEYWTITEEAGNPSPSVEFQGNAGLTNYFVPLTSYMFIIDSLQFENIHLLFDLKLNCINTSGDEKISIQIWDWMNQNWNVVSNVSNINGSFEWTRYNLTIYNHSNRIFRVRFLANGVNSNDISCWFIDNIDVYRPCYIPSELTTSFNDDGQVQLYWMSTSCGDWYNWISYCGYQYYNSIGTGSAAEFDVAARWAPSQLIEFANKSISNIAFIPAESEATYWIRIWEGDSAVLVYEQEVMDPVMNQENKVKLDTNHPIDITQTLWVGYHIETTTGYPAGTDEGPAYDGYGNMMYWEGKWQTLLELSPDLPYNWWIFAYIGGGDPFYCGNRIYRKINDGDYLRIADMEMTMHYIDEDADPADLNCYLVTDVRAKNYDTCESDYSNESCLQPVGLVENDDDDRLMVYPNPAKDQLFIEMPENFIELQLLDMTGRVVYESMISAHKITIPVIGFSQGIYLLKALTEEGMITRKVLIR